METIRTAVCIFKLYNDPNPLEIQAIRHFKCFEDLSLKHGLSVEDIDKSKTWQGFITNEGRYVTREEAYIIAKKAQQLIYDNHQEILYSEFCNFK